MTNEMVVTWYNGLLETNPAEVNNRLNEMMKTITHIPDQSDPAGAVMHYISEVVTKIRQMGMGSVFRD